MTETNPVSKTLCFLVIYDFEWWTESINSVILSIASSLFNYGDFSSSESSSESSRIVYRTLTQLPSATFYRTSNSLWVLFLDYCFAIECVMKVMGEVNSRGKERARSTRRTAMQLGWRQVERLRVGKPKHFTFRSPLPQLCSALHKRLWKYVLVNRGALLSTLLHDIGYTLFAQFAECTSRDWGHTSLVVRAVGYKSVGRGLETQWGEILNLPNPSGRTRPRGLLSLQQKWVPETFLLLNRAWLDHNSLSIKTSFTKLTINFFYLIYYLRYLVAKSLPLNHSVVWVPETLKKKFLGSKVRPVRGADNLTAIYELVF
jgi:hypothetical protein